MATFSVEFERRYRQRAKSLGRDLGKEESVELEAQLFQDWIDAGRFDELIRTVFSNHGREGGEDQIVVLGYHLRARRDAAHIHALFGGLISRRVKAFYEWWAKARDGHVGGMREAAKSSAEAMYAYAEYFISLDALGMKAEMEALRAEMLRFQAREPVAQVLPRRRPSVPGDHP